MNYRKGKGVGINLYNESKVAWQKSFASIS